MIAQALYAPPALLGLGDASGQPQRPDSDYSPVYNVTLSANQVLSDSKQIQHDADFILRAIFVNSATGAFSVRFNVNGFYYFSDAPLLSAAIAAADPASPFPIWPEFQIPAGGRIGLDLTELSGAPNTIQIIFRGCKRFV